MNESFKIREFKGAEATDTAFTALHIFENILRAERIPDDPPKSITRVKTDWQSIPPFIQMRAWVVWDQTETSIIAEGRIVIIDTEENQHLAQVNIGVLPAYRQQGIARALLRQITTEAETQNRRLLLGNTNERAPSGEQLMVRLGGSRGLATHLNQLTLSDVDRTLLQRWQQAGQRQTAEFELGHWKGSYPEAELANIVALRMVMNQQPLDELDVENFHMTEEKLRQIEASYEAYGIERWTLYVREKATNNLAGYTELIFLPDQPALAIQEDTGVFPQYRRRGLGRWLKAEMLQRVLDERPQVHFVRTGNADSNAAMLAINDELGFRPYLAEMVWQVETTKVRHYLTSSSPDL